MNKVSFVFQNSRLIKMSILENVRMGKPTATREEVASALKAAQCMDIIEKLSGGERQRISIARAFLKVAND